MKCDRCGVEGSGPRFLKRHPALCTKRAKVIEEKRKFSKQLAQGTRCIDYVTPLLEDERDIKIHFAALAEQLPYIWIDTHNEPVDLRQIPYEYAKNIRDWMISHSCGDTPYYSTPQFHCVIRAILKGEKWLDLARNSLKRKSADQ